MDPSEDLSPRPIVYKTIALPTEVKMVFAHKLYKIHDNACLIVDLLNFDILLCLSITYPIKTLNLRPAVSVHFFDKTGKTTILPLLCTNSLILVHDMIYKFYELTLLCHR